MSLVLKILEGVLAAGSTSISFTDTDIPNSLIRVYSTNPDLFPTSQTLSGNTLTITYEAQASNLYVAVEIAKQSLYIIDDLLSDDSNSALSANQGKELKSLIDAIDPISNLTELEDVDADNPQSGDVLMYNSTTEKWTKYLLPDIPVYLGDLGDIVLNSVTTGQFLVYNGAYWTNTTVPNAESEVF